MQKKKNPTKHCKLLHMNTYLKYKWIISSNQKTVIKYRLKILLAVCCLKEINFENKDTSGL